MSVALALLRLVQIDADTPRSQWSGSMAVFVDEGYKTLSARNMALFRENHWNPEDRYPGWMSASPLTQWPYFFAFRQLGVEVRSARLVTVALFLLLLVEFVLVMRVRYSAGLLLLGVLLLGVLETLFFFSRVALFEIPIATLLYLALFLLARPLLSRPRAALAVILASAFVVTLGIKSTGLLYFGVAAGGVLLAMKLRHAKTLRPTRGELIAAAVLVVLVVLTWSDWGSRFDLSPKVSRSFLLNPLTISSGLLIAAGLLSISQGLLTEGRRFLADPYRAALVCLATIGPLVLAMFPRNPLRYYVPLLPAFVLLIVEWLHLRLWQRPLPESPSPARVATSFALLVWAVLCVGQVVDHHLLTRLALSEQFSWLRGTGTGLWNSPRGLTALALGLVVGAVIWKGRRRVLRGRPVLGAVVVLVALEGAQGLLAEGRFFSAPTHETKQIAGLLEERLPQGASIAGDWAPRFALGTAFKALYMTTEFNHPRTILETRPDYYVFCDDPYGDGRKVRRMLEDASGVDLGAPVLEASYLDFDVIVYPLHYSAEAPEASESAAVAEQPPPAA